MYNRIRVTVTDKSSQALMLAFVEAWERLPEKDREQAPAVRDLRTAW